MRFIKARPDEKRPVFVFLQQSNGLFGHLAVRMLPIPAGRIGQEGHCPTKAPFRGAIDDVRFEGGLVPAGRVEALAPGSPVIEAAGPDVVGIAVVVHFAHPPDIVALVEEQLRQGHHLGQALAEVVGEIKDAGRVRPQASKHRGATGAAERKLAVGALKAHAAGGQPIDVGRFHQRMPIAAQVGIHVVNRDEQHVQRLGALSPDGKGQPSEVCTLAQEPRRFSS